MASEMVYKMAAEAILKRIAKRRLPPEEYRRLEMQLNRIKARVWARKGEKKLKEIIESVREYLTPEDEEECRQVLSQELGGTLQKKTFEEFVAGIQQKRTRRRWGW